MRSIKKTILWAIGLLFIISICFPIFTSAVKPMGYPPEWIVATGARVTKGYTYSGTYRNTYYYDENYHIIKCYEGGGWGPWEGVVYYSFGDFKCNRLKIFATTFPWGIALEVYVVYVGYDEIYLGYYASGSWKTISLNPTRYVHEIKIRLYMFWGLPSDRFINMDYIRVLTTGQP